MSKAIFRLVHENARRNAISAVARAPEGYVCEVKEATRTLLQNAKLHAMCGDVAKQALFHGKKRSAQQWKVIFISGHAVATGLGADIVPGLEGEFVNIRESSAQMGIKRLNSLIEYVYAYGSENGIKWTEPDQGYEEIRGAA